MRESQTIWEARLKDMTAQVALAEARSREVNTVIETQIVERVKIVKDTKNANKETAKLIARQLDDRCVVPESTVVLINSASQNEVARGASSTDGSASDVRASEVVETVVENYGRYNELREKVIAWQNWYRDQRKIFEGAKQ
jgi:lipase chaperone LimK